MKIQTFDYKFAFEKSTDQTEGFIKGIATTPRLDTYDDIIATGAFSESIKKRGVKGPQAIKMLAQHDSRHVIGNWLDMKYEGEALVVSGQIDLESKKGQEYYNYVKKDQVGSMSVGFTTQTRQFDEETYVRTIIKGDLREISLVTFPANEDATITEFKNAEDGEEEILKLSDLEKKLARDFGLSRKQSCGVIRVIRSSRLLASASLVPETREALIEPRVDESHNNLLKTIEDLKTFSALEEIRKLTERLRA